MKKERKAELADVGGRRVFEKEQPSAMVFAVPSLADRAEVRRGFQNRLRAEREVAEGVPRFFDG